MLYYDFGDYEGFKKRFGIERDENGKLLRKNKILLSFVKNKNLFRHTVREVNRMFWGNYINATSLNVAMKKVHFWMREYSKGGYALYLKENRYYSDIYQTDDRDGMPEDGSIGFIRYRNMERGGKVYKMKAGKMYKHFLDNNIMSQCISDEMKTYMCEVLTETWKAFQESVSTYELHVNDNFSKIYDSCWMAGDFGSCMTDKEYHNFYKNVDASAAYLTRQSDGLIVARCVIFNKVHDLEGNTYRLAERQYAADGNQVHMRMMVDRLKEEGYIDGHKAIGAGCRDAMNFVLNDGSSLNRKLYIESDLDADDTISYQDSFKWYVPYKGAIYNYRPLENSFSLEVTDGKIDGVHYDEWNEYYTFNDVVTCYAGETAYDVDECCLDDFVEVDGVYYHEDDVSYCEEREEPYLTGGDYYSELTEGHYCCAYCLDEAEERYRKEHGMEDAA